MLTWINNNAKWIIYIFVAGIVAGLLFMDMAGLQTDRTPPVGKDDGEPLENGLFDRQLQQVQAQAQASDPNMGESARAALRQNLFRQFVQRHILLQEIQKAEVQASVYEMQQNLRAEPPQGITQVPDFQANGRFDTTKYYQWLDDPATYDNPFMLDYEQALRSEIIPQKQIREIVTAGYHPSTLEAKWNAKHRKTEFDFWLANANMGAFPAPDSVPQAQVDSLFRAMPDSFYVQADMAQVDFVSLPIQPSQRDEASTLEFATLLLNQLKDGANFAEIAKSNSEDLGSAQNGGSLGGWSNGNQWVSEFRKAALALDSGALSEPVRSQYGYHILLSEGKRVKEDSTTEVKVSHVLLGVNASSETIDSLENILNELKAEVDAGKSLESVATAYKLTAKSSPWFGRGDSLPGLGYIPGLSSYAFLNPELPKPEGIASEVLKNDKTVALFVKTASLDAGSRNEAAAQETIVQKLKTNARLAAAQKSLEGSKGALETLASLDSGAVAAIQNASVQDFQQTYEGYVPGLGFASVANYEAFSQAKQGAWSGPFVGTGPNPGAVMLKVLSVKAPTDAELQTAIQDEMQSRWLAGGMGAFGEFIQNLESGAHVVNNLDIFYRE
jgi:peptidyl-prolyl cis-trans isomerase D